MLLANVVVARGLLLAPVVVVKSGGLVVSSSLGGHHGHLGTRQDRWQVIVGVVERRVGQRRWWLRRHFSILILKAAKLLHAGLVRTEAEQIDASIDQADFSVCSEAVHSGLMGHVGLLDVHGRSCLVQVARDRRVRLLVEAASRPLRDGIGELARRRAADILPLLGLLSRRQAARLHLESVQDLRLGGRVHRKVFLDALVEVNPLPPFHNVLHFEGIEVGLVELDVQQVGGLA